MMKDVKAPFIVFAGSFPKEKEIEAAKATGAKVMCFASTESIAERMIRFGADAIILEGSEAGGHIGHVATTVLVQQVLYKFCDQIPIFVAGGIGNAIDRFTLGFVVDFIEPTFIDFPIFNVADIGVTCGIILFIVSLLIHERTEAKRAVRGSENGGGE